MHLISQIKLECKLIHDKARMPFRIRPTDAGYDLSSIEDVVVHPNAIINVRTGVILVAPAGYYLSVEGRSSLWSKGILPFSGIIDGGYTGELMIAITNVSNDPYKISCGDRIAQVIVHKIEDCYIDLVEDISPEYNIRSTLGYGSSGR